MSTKPSAIRTSEAGRDEGAQGDRLDVVGELRQLRGIVGPHDPEGEQLDHHAAADPHDRG